MKKESKNINFFKKIGPGPKKFSQYIIILRLTPDVKIYGVL